MIPKYIINQIQKTEQCPVPCRDIVPNTKRLETEVHKIKIALRAEYPEITEITFYLFSEEEGNKKGIDGRFQYLEGIKPVIGIRADLFNDGVNYEYQIYVLLHECAHRIQPIKDSNGTELNHGIIFNDILDKLIDIYT